ncbi:MAG: hypothetical protein ABJG41_07320 [Cyclobacteriaceae bacterium]
MSFRHVTAVAFFAATFFTSYSSWSQNSMGVGTNTPNPNAVLELVSPTGDQGFLVPRYTTAERTATSFTSNLSSTDNGLLVFDSDEGHFYCWFNTDWQLISNQGSSVSAGTGIDIDGSGVISNTGDLDATNEIQDLDLTGDVLSITNNGSATPVDLSVYMDDTDDQTAAEVGFTPSGNLISEDVQSALAELDANDSDDQIASEVVFTPSGNLISTDVQSALSELDGAMSGLGAGDMTAATYDVNVDNRVDLAEAADSLSINFVDGVTMGYNPASKWIEVQDDGITEAKIADGSVTGSKIGVLASEGDAMVYSSGSWQAGALPTSPWASSGSDITFEGGNVGIGTTTPMSPLQIGEKISFFTFQSAVFNLDAEIIGHNIHGVGDDLINTTEDYTSMIFFENGEIQFLHGDSIAAGLSAISVGALDNSLTLLNSGDAEFRGAVEIGGLRGDPTSGMIQYNGEFQGYDGAEWKPLGGLTFPASYSISDTGYSPFYIENDNGGGVAGFHVNNVSAFAPALSVSTNAQSSAIPAMELLQDGYGNGLELTVSDNSNNENGVLVKNFGLGTAGYFENDNGSNNSNAVEARITNGGGRAIQAVMDGDGQIANFSSTSATNGSVAFSVSSEGTNSTALFQNSSNATITPAVEIQNNGGGAGLTIQNPGGTTSFGDVSFINGDLGIGQFTPSAKLDVVGDTELNGDLVLEGSLSTSGAVAHSGSQIVNNSDYTVQPSDYIINLNGTGNQNFNITLPDANVNQGRELIFVVQSFAIQYNIQLMSGDSFARNNGAINTNDLVMSNYAYGDWYFVTLRAVGSNWYVTTFLINGAA